MNEFNRKIEAYKSRARLSSDKRLNTLLNNVVEEVKTYSDSLMQQIGQLSDIGRALSGIHDLNALLEMICDQARRFTRADGCALYSVEKDLLHFKIIQSHSLKIQMGGKDGDAIPFPPVQMKESNVSAYVAMKGVPVNIADVYDTDLFDFTGPKEFDHAFDYRSKSMLVVPMRNHDNEVIGVLQLLNAMDPSTGEVIPFSPDFENLTESLASQAAVAITNVQLINDMESLFESFVEVMATAIDEKSPVTGGHIRRVANLTMVMAEAIHDAESGTYKDVHFSPEKFHEMRIAAWMHDIGKVTTPVEIIEKSKKLQTIFDRIHFVDLRMQYILQKKNTEMLQTRMDFLENKLSDQDFQLLEKRHQEGISRLKEIRSFLKECNEPSEFLDDPKIERLQEIARMTYCDESGNEQPMLSPDELENLSIRKGSITEAERGIMQNHAQVTLDMLNKIPFTRKLKNIPNFAGAHHEYLNGKGYPLGWKGEEIPFEGRLMAITDIAEALTASDRPYKKSMPLEKVYTILRDKVSRGELDSDLVEFFICENIYERYKKQYEEPSSGKPNPS